MWNAIIIITLLLASVAEKLRLRINRPKNQSGKFRTRCTNDHCWWYCARSRACLVYLGSSISGDSTASLDDVECRIGKAAGALAWLKVCVWKRCNTSLTAKLKIFNTLVVTTLLYASECWTLLATDLIKLGGFPAELPLSNPWGDPMWSLTQWCVSPPLQETAHCWEVDTMDLCLMVQPCIACVAWTTPVCQNAFYGQSARAAGVVLLMHSRNNGKTRSLPTPRRISPGASTVTPCRATAADMTAERGAWRGLRCDITGIKQRRDDSSKRAHPDAISIDG